MDPFEKLALKKEITTEVREDLARSTGTLIASRIIHAMSVGVIELFLWVAIIALAAKDMTVGDGVSISFLLFLLRIAQMFQIKWFNNK